MSFFYDQLGRLIQENRRDLSKSYFYGYDDAGNQTYTWEYNYTSVNGLPAEYPLSVKNFGHSTIAAGMTALTSFDGGTITYDNAGNPLQYYNGMNFTWKDGRQLKSISNTNLNLNFKYDASGMRTEKTGNVNGTVVNTKYFYDGTFLVAYQEGNNRIWFLKDEVGELIGFTYDHHSYYYIKNLQGDVLGIVDETGISVVDYWYNAWGELNSITGDTTLGELNPIRYRSYVYDNETGFYYLCSRYYDPSTGRFLNADLAEYLGVTGTLMSYNLYSYCEGNPINYIDSSGKLLDRIAPTTTSMAFGAATILMPAFLGAWIDTGMGLPTMMYYLSRINNTTKASFNFNDNSIELFGYIRSQIILRLKNSTDFMDVVRRMTKENDQYERRSFAWKIEDVALRLSLGRAIITINRIQNAQRFVKYEITIWRELYDFHYLTKDDKYNTYEKLINNYLGFWPQVFGILHPYYWTMSFTLNQRR